MKLTIDNFAKIKEAKIEFNGITVIAGENNTGKSTVGKVLYSLFTSFHNLENKVSSERTRGISRTIFNNEKINVNMVDKLDDLIHSLSSATLNSISEVNDIFYSHFNKYLSKDTINEIEEQLLFDNKELESLIVKSIFENEFANQISPKFKLKNQSLLTLEIKENKIDLLFDNSSFFIKEKMMLDHEAIYIDNPFILDEISKYDYSHKYNYINFILGRRNEYNHNVVLKAKLAESFSTQKHTLIDEAIYDKKVNTCMDKIIKTIRGNLVEKNDRFTFADSDCNSEIELMNLSTGIKSFAIILKLIESRDIMNKSLIILDEPEVHLHPTWQLIYAELLVLLQKEFDLNLLITSHSPYFINALEAYSSKYEIADKCKFYLSSNNEEGRSVFEDVSCEVDKIYEKLMKPLNELEDLLYGSNWLI